MAKDAAALQEPVRARPGVVDVRPAHRGHGRAGSRRSSPASPASATPTWPPSARATTSARPPSSWRCTTRSSRRRPSPAPTATSTARARTAMGLIAASVKSGLPLFLRQLPDHARVGAAARAVAPQELRRAHAAGRGRDRGGQHGARRRLRRQPRRHRRRAAPGIDLKAETIGLAVALELPMVIIDVQRAGPVDRACPPRPRQADLMMAMYGRHGESPLPVVAAYTPGQCFDAAIEAARIAVKYRTPGDPAHRTPSSPTRPSRGGCRTSRTLPDDRSRASPPSRTRDGELPALPARREPGAAVGGARARRACATGSAGSRRRTAPATSATTPTNHALMTRLRAEKVAEDRRRDPAARGRPRGRRRGAGARLGLDATARSRAAVRRVRLEGKKVASAHLLPPQPAAVATPARCCAPTARS